ncbi:hypothetical protein SPYJRS4_1335 [Streptococcus pyogenes JRS4]|nr:hypothetical protein CFA72_02995 [Streptococcus pyogenes]BAR44835.1 hypothetical protein SPYJRS4_1335 [Streptococcus pyogenes JRS4]
MASTLTLTPLLPQRKTSVLAHSTRRNRKLDVKSAELFMLFEPKTEFVCVLSTPWECWTTLNDSSVQDNVCTK